MTIRPMENLPRLSEVVAICQDCRTREEMKQRLEEVQADKPELWAQMKDELRDRDIEYIVRLVLESGKRWVLHKAG